jgi:mRNA interferase MazF
MASKLNRGNVHWVNLEPAQGSEIKKIRPGVLIGATPLNQVRRTVLIVPLSTAGEARPPITVKVHCQGKEVLAVCDQLRAVDRTRLVGWIEQMSPEDLEAISQSLKRVLALP